MKRFILLVLILAGLAVAQPTLIQPRQLGIASCTAGQAIGRGASATQGACVDNATALTGDVTASGSGSVVATIAANAVTNAKAAQMAANTLKGNATAVTATAQDLTVAQVQTLLRIFPTRATVAASAAINTTNTYISPTTFSITANSLVVGDAFRLNAYGTNTSTAAQVNTFTPRFGTAGTTADTALTAFAVTSAATGTNIPFRLELTCTVRAIGASGSFYCFGALQNQGTTGISTTTNVVNTGGVVTVNTTVTAILGLSFVTTATTTTTTFQMVSVSQL